MLFEDSGLHSIYFYCNAPADVGEYVFNNCASDFTIYYAEGTKGWTTPTWNSYPVKEFDPSIGDLNGDGKVNTSDAAIVLKAAAGILNLTENQKSAGITNFDGKVNTADAVLILKYAAGMIEKF